MKDTREPYERDTQENWAIAKRELRKLGIAVNTRRKSCLLGCACVEDEWDDKVKDTPHLWQTGKRFSSEHGGYLNHSDLTDSLKLAIMRTLAENRIPYKWQHPDRHAIEIKLSAEAEL
jgi:hypothetical protein